MVTEVSLLKAFDCLAGAILQGDLCFKNLTLPTSVNIDESEVA